MVRGRSHPDERQSVGSDSPLGGIEGGSSTRGQAIEYGVDSGKSAEVLIDVQDTHAGFEQDTPSLTDQLIREQP